MTKSKRKPHRNKTRVLIVEDEEMMREALRNTIDAQPDMEVAAEAQDANTALDCVRKHRFDLTVADIRLEGRSGIELIQDIRVTNRDMPVLVYTYFDEWVYGVRAIKAGAKGYLTKRHGRDELVKAIRTVRDGDLYITKNLQQALILELAQGGRAGPYPALQTLSARQMEIFRRLGHAEATAYIAKALGSDRKTVESHIARIIRKLQLRTIHDLRHYAAQWVLTTLTSAEP